MNRKVISIVAIILIAFGGGYVLSKQGNTTEPEPANNSSSADIPTTNENGKELDLSGKQLTSLPDDVLGQANITSLNLSNNQLTTLPAGISQLVNLQTLNIENNRIASLPSEISQLKNLREIRANNNRLTSLPDFLGSMTWLQLIDISGNDIPADQAAELKAKLPNTQVKT